MKMKIIIEGMSCMNCVKHVKNALSAIDGVKNIEVDLAGKYAVIDCNNVPDEKIKESVEDAGYDVIEIKKA